MTAISRYNAGQWPIYSHEKLDPRKLFPQVIVYKLDKTCKLDYSIRRYWECGCYDQVGGGLPEGSFKCITHDGEEPTLWDDATQGEELLKQVREVNRDLIPLLERKAVLYKRIKTLEKRSQSPKRKNKRVLEDYRLVRSLESRLAPCLPPPSSLDGRPPHTFRRSLDDARRQTSMTKDVDISRFPKDSYARLSPHKPFPQRVIFKVHPDGLHLYRRYDRCGCNTQFYDETRAVDNLFCKFHGGEEPCFLSDKERADMLRGIIARLDTEIADIMGAYRLARDRQNTYKKRLTAIRNREKSPKRQ